MKNPQKCVLLKTKSKEIEKVKTLERSKTTASDKYDKATDAFDEHIFRMDNQTFKNLHQLDNYKHFV